MKFKRILTGGEVLTPHLTARVVVMNSQVIYGKKVSHAYLMIPIADFFLSNRGKRYNKGTIILFGVFLSHQIEATETTNGKAAEENHGVILITYNQTSEIDY